MTEGILMLRVCKNKKCQKVLTAGYRHRYCEACRNKHAQTAKNVLKRDRRLEQRL